MIPRVRRTGQGGLTLLEVLVAIMLVCTTVMAFASVYPMAFKLNRKANRSAQASEYASAVVEELRALPCNRPGTFTGIGGTRYIEDFVYTNGRTWKPTDTPSFPVEEIPEGFRLMSRDGTRSGILVQGSVAAGGFYGKSDQFWVISVTVFWDESVNGALVEKSACVQSARTGNR